MLSEPDFNPLDTDETSSPVVFRPRIVLEPPTTLLPPPVLEPPILTLGPSISSLSPTSGARGTQVTINGSGFLGTQAVRFGGFDSRSFTVAAETQIIAQVPPDAVTGPVTVVGPNGSATGGTFTVLASSPLPIVSSFFPLSGAFGTRITITGSNLQPATQVLFNTTPAPFVINTPTQIVVDVPAGSTSGRITVGTPAGTAQSQGIFVVIQPSQLPTISGFSPASGPAGTAVDVFGNNFLGTQEVRFNGVPSNQVTVSSNGQIRAQAPANAGTGPISVITGTGTATSAGAFSVQAASPLPTISFFNPISGQAGAAVTITGTSFVNVQSVKFNGVAAAFFVNSASSITANVPAGAASGLITVTTAAGTASSTQGFVVIAPSQLPGIAAFSPPSGPAGTIVTIDGNNFLGASQVRFNGVSAPSFTVQSSTRITAQAPANAGMGPISVTTPTGTATSAGFFSVTATPLPQPVITGFSPASGPVGTSVTIFGSSFLGATQVRFGGVPAVFTLLSATQIAAKVPVGAVTGPITVTTPAGTASSPTAFPVVLPPAALLSFSPASGAPGTVVSLNGSNLAGVTAVRFNGVSASFTVISSTLVQTVVPAGATSGRISVTTPTGTVQSSTNFTVVQVPALPTITALSPASGQAGTMVIVTGTQLGNATAVRFNGKDAASFTVQSLTQVSAMVPLGAATGPVSVVTPAGTAVSPVAFTVLPGTMPGTKKLRKRAAAGTLPQAVSEVVPVMLRAGAAAFTDEIVAERVISGLLIQDLVQLTVSGSLPKGSATVQPSQVVTFQTVATVRLEAGVATPPEVYTIEIRGKSLIDGEDYDPIVYSIGVDPAVLIDVDPSSASVRAGKSVRFSVLLDRSPGAAGLPVKLSALDLPDDTTAVFAEETTTGTSTTLRVRTTPSTPPVEDKKLRVRGTATFQGSNVVLRDRPVKLTVKEPRVQLLIDPAKQSQTVEAGKSAEFPFTIRRNAFEGRLFAAADTPDFVIGVTQTPSNPVEGESLSFVFLTSSELMEDKSALIDVSLKDADGTLMATATVQLKAVAVLNLGLEIEDKEDNQVVAGDPISFPVVINRSGLSRPVDLVVANAGDLAARGITAGVNPTPNMGTMATLEVTTLTSTPLGSHTVRVEARLDGRVLAFDSVDVEVLGKVRLQLDDTSFTGARGQTFSTTLRVVQRIGFPGPVPVQIQKDGDVDVQPDPLSVQDATGLSLTLGREDPGITVSVDFIPDLPDNVIPNVVGLAVQFR